LTPKRHSSTTPSGHSIGRPHAFAISQFMTIALVPSIELFRATCSAISRVAETT
jgi:hypothetical protein